MIFLGTPTMFLRIPMIFLGIPMIFLGIPLFFFTFLYGPIVLTQEIVSLITSLSLWFFGLTAFSIFLYTRLGGVTRSQALILITSYVTFILFIFWKAYNVSGGF